MGNEYAYSSGSSYATTVPDFNFHCWKEAGIDDYDETIKLIDEAGQKPFEVNKVGWIGSMNHRRRKLYDIGHDHQDLFDIQEITWINTGDVKLFASNYMSMPDLVKKYSILIDIEGAGYSGRLKHLLWSHRPLLLIDRPHKEFFFENLKPWEHYIPVERDLSDLVEKAKWCVDHYDEALKIAENAYNFCKSNLTREACYKQWDKIITRHQQGLH
jgi:hypothetical protein